MGFEPGNKAGETHGHTSRAGASPEYNAWRNMRERCNRKSNREYKNYGGRGIRVCAQWNCRKGFAVFLEDMGPRPPGATLDRKDPNGHYTPDNCRWATQEEQANNTRRSHKITAEGRTLTIAQWARLRGREASLINQRLRHGWDELDAVTRPVKGRRPR